MNVIKTENLTVRYDDRVILDRLTFGIPEGSITAIIGPNGSGKTTLLKALLNLIPFEGKIEIFGRPLPEVRQFIGYVPQRFQFDKTFPITVQEFMSLEPQKAKVTKEQIDSSLIEAGMSDAHDVQLGKLSGGQLQRVLIAKTLLKHPRLLFLDEPSAGIDIQGERNFYDLVQHLNQRHQVTVILVSHEIDIVHSYATQVICLNKQMLCIGKPHDILTDKTLKLLYDDNISVYQHKFHKHD